LSIHRSLQTRGALTRSRNVLTRYERIVELRKNGKWEEGESTAYGLPKVRVQKVKKRVKDKKEPEGDEAAVDTTTTTTSES
jgi:small basic protein (TIGR04137 family)